MEELGRISYQGTERQHIGDGNRNAWKVRGYYYFEIDEAW